MLMCQKCEVVCRLRDVEHEPPLVVTGQGTSMVSVFGCPECGRTYKRRYGEGELAKAFAKALLAAAVQAKAG